jgi:hypothetical protein
MPILFLALLAMLVFGMIGILLTTAMILEHSKRRRLARNGTAPSVPAGTIHP